MSAVTDYFRDLADAIRVIGGALLHGKNWTPPPSWRDQEAPVTTVSAAAAVEQLVADGVDRAVAEQHVAGYVNACSQMGMPVGAGLDGGDLSSIRDGIRMDQLRKETEQRHADDLAAHEARMEQASRDAGYANREEALKAGDQLSAEEYANLPNSDPRYNGGRADDPFEKWYEEVHQDGATCGSGHCDRSDCIADAQERQWEEAAEAQNAQVEAAREGMQPADARQILEDAESIDRASLTDEQQDARYVLEEAARRTLGEEEDRENAAHAAEEAAEYRREVADTAAGMTPEEARDVIARENEIRDHAAGCNQDVSHCADCSREESASYGEAYARMVAEQAARQVLEEEAQRAAAAEEDSAGDDEQRDHYEDDGTTEEEARAEDARAEEACAAADEAAEQDEAEQQDGPWRGTADIPADQREAAEARHEAALQGIEELGRSGGKLSQDEGWQKFDELHGQLKDADRELCTDQEFQELYGETKAGEKVTDDQADDQADDEPEKDGASAAEEEAHDAREDDARGNATSDDAGDEQGVPWRDTAAWDERKAAAAAEENARDERADYDDGCTDEAAGAVTEDEHRAEDEAYAEKAQREDEAGEVDRNAEEEDRIDAAARAAAAEKAATSCHDAADDARDRGDEDAEAEWRALAEEHEQMAAAAARKETTQGLTDEQYAEQAGEQAAEPGRDADREADVQDLVSRGVSEENARAAVDKLGTRAEAERAAANDTSADDHREQLADVDAAEADAGARDDAADAMRAAAAAAACAAAEQAAAEAAADDEDDDSDDSERRRDSDEEADTE